MRSYSLLSLAACAASVLGSAQLVLAQNGNPGPPSVGAPHTPPKPSNAPPSPSPSPPGMGNGPKPPSQQTPSGWPYGPFTSDGRDMKNAKGQAVTWVGVNWPMSGETMVFEGLEHAPAEKILDMLVDVGFNQIRAGYAIEQINQVYDNGGKDVALQDAMVRALGKENGTRVANGIVKNNPSLKLTSGLFDVWSHVADLAADRGILMHPDVHVGKAEWCCSHTDGNSWFDDLTFPADKWRRGLAYVANWAKKHRNIVSMSLRNELRDSWNMTDSQYNWQTLVGNMTAGADAIHQANPDLLISFSGMQFDQDLSALTADVNILTAPCYRCRAIRDADRLPAVKFNVNDYPFSKAGKLLWELHLYDGSEDLDTGNCDVIRAELYRNGFNALGIDAPAGCNITNDCPPAKTRTPLYFSEFGHAQDSSLYNDLLQNCIKDITIEHQVPWSMWSLAGSYRIRQGIQGFEDTWGLTTADWSGWRDPETIQNYWKPWIKQMNPTYA